MILNCFTWRCHTNTFNHKFDCTKFGYVTTRIRVGNTYQITRHICFLMNFFLIEIRVTILQIVCILSWRCVGTFGKACPQFGTNLLFITLATTSYLPHKFSVIGLVFPYVTLTINSQYFKSSPYIYWLYFPSHLWHCRPSGFFLLLIENVVTTGAFVIRSNSTNQVLQKKYLQQY